MVFSGRRPRNKPSDLITAKKSEPPVVTSSRGFLFSAPGKGKGEHVIDFSKRVREIREMAEKLPNWKFLLIWLVFLILAAGYFIGQIRWW